MVEKEAFDNAAFLGLARTARRDPYRLTLFARHLEPGERPAAVLPIQAGTLIVTDRRVFELRAHLDVHAAWNVQEFQGYAVHRSIDRGEIRDLARRAERATGPSGTPRTEDRLVLMAGDRKEEFLVSRGPEPTLSEADVAGLPDAVLGRQAK